MSEGGPNGGDDDDSNDERHAEDEASKLSCAYIIIILKSSCWRVRSGASDATTTPWRVSICNQNAIGRTRVIDTEAFVKP